MPGLFQRMLLIVCVALALPVVHASSPETEADAFVKAGYRYSLQGDHRQCDENYRKAIALNPKGAGYRVSYGWALLNLGDYAGALQVWQHAFLGVDQDYANQAVCQALAYYRLGRLEQAVEWYQVQCRYNHEFTSMNGMRLLTGYWQVGEKQALEAVYKLWLKADDQAGQFLPRLHSVPRDRREYEKLPDTSPALAGYELEVQQHLDQYFLQELKVSHVITVPDQPLTLDLTIHPDGKIDVDPREVQKNSFAQPVYSVAMLRAVATLAENPVRLPREILLLPAGLKLRAKFEVQLTPE